ncbi:MAG: hypothetical protein ABFD12_03835 [Syntrophorhabdus sp.]
MRKACLILVFILCTGIAVSHGASTPGPTNNDYCVYPIFASSGVKPNILIVMDFSGSMQFPAYLPITMPNWGSYDGNVAEMVNQRISTTTNYDKRYDPDRDYYGLFESDQYYTQQSGKYTPNTACSTYANRIGVINCLSGNFLNWLTATRVDTARRALTGGRTNTGTTQLESEGAQYIVHDRINKCTYTVTANVTANRSLKIQNITDGSGGTCVAGQTPSNHGIFVNVPSGTDVSGLVQDFYDKAHMELMVYSSASGSFDRVGVMRSGKDSPLSQLLSGINNETPYGGKPTGEALWEAYDFFKQQNLHSYTSNSSYLGLANGVKDPWYDGSGSGLPVPCRKCFVLLISDGVWDDTEGGTDPMRVAREMRVNDLRPELDGVQNVTTYGVYAFGIEADGKRAMKTTTMFGGFDFTPTDKFPYPYTTWPATDSRSVTWPIAQCDFPTHWDSSCNEWDKNKANLPYNYFEADDGSELRSKLEAALTDMLRRASSGTAASVLASSEGSGANLLQAFFFPKKQFEDVEIDWTGEMQNLWYYIDPELAASTIREDTAQNNILDIFSDDIVEYVVDSNTEKTVARRYSVTPSHTKGAEDAPSPVQIDEVKNLWEAGSLLWARNTPRTIYTTVDGVNLINFSEAEASTNSLLQTALQVPGDAATAQKIVRYINGTDITGYRNRTVTMTVNGTPTENVWKLGDIVSSTPRLKASFPLQSYHSYPPDGYNDRTYYQYVNDVDASGNPAGNYKARGTAFVGANDGMLHAFELGKLSFDSLSSTQAARLSPAGGGLGTESWAFVPKGALPYLKYLTSTAYCHVSYINAPVTIFDASVAGAPGAAKTRNSWRTIVIGAMGIGGACRNKTASCTGCVKTPVPDVGYSSYFAFDITDPASPVFLWEFSRPDLGFATTGPAIVRIGDPDTNGNWFVVFGSGPTGPINTTDHQFMGSSDQELKFFIMDLWNGPKSAVTVKNTGISNAFGGSLASGVQDIDRGDQTATGATPYSDDVIYLGYTKKNVSTWTLGGIARLVTNNSTDPGSWQTSILIDNIGPVTAAINKLHDRTNRKFWIYAGTGRYFYRLSNALDDPDTKQSFYGIMEPCYDVTKRQFKFGGCPGPATLTKSDLADQTAGANTIIPTSKWGWYIDFPTPAAPYKAHRVLAQPAVSFNGVVYFLTSTPTSDICSFGGYTYVWAVWYATGLAPPESALGMLITQLSTGRIANPLMKKDDMNVTGSGGRAAQLDVGLVIGPGPGLQALPKPIRKILHMKER